MGGDTLMYVPTKSSGQVLDDLMRKELEMYIKPTVYMEDTVKTEALEDDLEIAERERNYWKHVCVGLLTAMSMAKDPAVYSTMVDLEQLEHGCD